MTSPIAGDYATVPATLVEARPGYAYLVRAGDTFLGWVRAEDVDPGRPSFRARISAVGLGTATLTVHSPTDRYEVSVPVELVEGLSYTEHLDPGHVYRGYQSPDMGWLYDGEAFYPVDTFPRGAVDRDQLPPRLEDLGHLRDL